MLVPVAEGRAESRRSNRLMRAPDALFRAGAFGVVVLGHSTPLPVTLSGSSQQVWELLATPRTFAGLIDDLCRLYDGVEGETIAADVGPVVDRLADLGILEIEA